MRQILCLLVVLVFLQGCSKNAETYSGPLKEIFSQLDASRQESLSLEEVQKILDKVNDDLRAMGTNVFTHIVEEMNSFKIAKIDYPWEDDKNIEKRFQNLQLVFGLLGKDMEPIIPEFVANLDTNRNFLTGISGLVNCGSLGMPYLEEALNHPDEHIREAVTISLIVKKNRSPDWEPSPELSKAVHAASVSLLENKSDEVKCLAAFGVADYCTDPKESISILMDRFTKETSPIVRIAFIKFSGQIYREFPDSDKNFLTTLEKIAKDENNEDKVRKVAQFVLKDITEQESISEEQT
ncbi:MAG: hypothetical protein J5672_08570 [Verrucomicrobia bacterium]|nr:hypothetical protein [Verrucomicrobiota bacterium]